MYIHTDLMNNSNKKPLAPHHAWAYMSSSSDSLIGQWIGTGESRRVHCFVALCTLAPIPPGNVWFNQCVKKNTTSFVTRVYVFVHHVGVNVCVCECVNVRMCECMCVHHVGANCVDVCMCVHNSHICGSICVCTSWGCVCVCI